VFRVEVFMVSTSAWIVGCSAGSSGLLSSVVATWGSADGCGCAVWGYVCGLHGCLGSGEDLTSDHLG
jgi:hypothetical protein